MKNHFGIIMLLMVLFLSSCSVTKYVPKDDLLLNKTKIKSDIPDITSDYLKDYLQQTPNSYLLGMTRMSLRSEERRVGKEC